ncbi:hypothetical protein pb186bvf_018101 [Paramecium bursaria]
MLHLTFVRRTKQKSISICFLNCYNCLIKIYTQLFKFVLRQSHYYSRMSQRLIYKMIIYPQYNKKILNVHHHTKKCI